MICVSIWIFNLNFISKSIFYFAVEIKRYNYLEHAKFNYTISWVQLICQESDTQTNFLPHNIILQYWPRISNTINQFLTSTFSSRNPVNNTEVENIVQVEYVLMTLPKLWKTTENKIILKTWQGYLMIDIW